MPYPQDQKSQEQDSHTRVLKRLAKFAKINLTKDSDKQKRSHGSFH